MVNEDQTPELSWTTHILCNYLGIGYFFEGCRNEMVEYTTNKIDDEVSRLEKLEKDWDKK